MTLHQFNHARRAIERERFQAAQQTTFDIAIERTHFEEQKARRIIELTESLVVLKKAVSHRAVQERKILREQQNRRRLQQLKDNGGSVPVEGIRVFSSSSACSA